MPYALTYDQIAEKYANEVAIVEEPDSGMDNDLFSPTVAGDAYASTEVATYLVWLGKQDVQVDAQKLAVLTLACVKRGMWWSEVAEDLGLPVPPDWEL